jgi:SAM-dependent methyltransferase
LRPVLRDQPRVLEIGANANGIARFADVAVIAADLDPVNLIEARAARGSGLRPVAADIGALPFASHTFDAVVCVDTFEHLPEIVRPAAVREIARLLRPDGVAVVAFPSGEAAARAERRIAGEYRRLTGRSLSWFEQHEARGLPNAQETAGLFRAALDMTHAIAVTRNTSIAAWVWMWRVLLCGWPGHGNAVFQVLLRWLTPVLCRMHYGRCYRTIVWAEPLRRKDAR